MKSDILKEAQQMAQKVTTALTGYGIWGVEFFVADDGVYFSELSPRPHDTGMVTLAKTQNFNEFELHLRAVLGLPISEITQERIGASAVILATENSENPKFEGIETVAATSKIDFRIFGKPTSRPFRRMGVVLAYDNLDGDISEVTEKAKRLAQKVIVVSS
jgi:phosphoribosylglycinamide formyltransferase 2